MKFQSEGFTIEKKLSNIFLFVVIELVPNTLGQLLNNLLNKITAIDNKKSKTRVDFIKKSSDVLEPDQQLLLLMFEPKVKSEVQRDMRERFKPSKRGGMKKQKRRF